jgi:hypothetical protein
MARKTLASALLAVSLLMCAGLVGDAPAQEADRTPRADKDRSVARGSERGIQSERARRAGARADDQDPDQPPKTKARYKDGPSGYEDPDQPGKR